MFKKTLLLMLLMAFAAPWAANAQQTVTATCYPPTETYATGYTDGTDKTTGQLHVESAGGDRGWMKFDVSAIPDGATINSITLKFYCISGSNPYVNLTAAGELDPATASASELFSAIGTQSPNYFTSTYISGLNSEGWKSFGLSSNAISNLQNNGLTNDYFTVGFYAYETYSYDFNAYGYDEADYKPYIEVTYASTEPYVELSPATAKIQPGATETLTATPGNITGTPTYSYSSSNTSVATVSGSGTTATVTGVAVGTATITVTMNYEGTNYTATSEITVSNEITVSIGSGTGTSYYLPTHTNYKYSYTQQIYTATELGNNAGTIKSVSFKGATARTRTLDIYMVNTDKEYFESKTDYVAVTNANLVYTGSVSFVANDWTTITLTGDGFDYEGGNLVIVVDDNTGSDPGSTNWSSFNATSNQGLYFYQDGSNINPASPSASNNAVTTSKNQIQIGIVPSNTPKPKNLTVSNLSSSGATLAWEAPASGTPTGYQYQYKTNADVWPTTWNNVNALTVTLNTLTSGTEYAFRVRATYAEGESEPIETTFTTLDDCAVPTNFAATLVSGNGSVATFSWTKGFATDDDWELQYGTDATFANCTTITDGFTVNGNTVTFNATNGITAEQLHYARVRTDCGGTYSSYTDAVVFTPTNYVDFTYGATASTTNNYIPFYGYYANDIRTISQYIIPATELLDIAGATIRSLTYYTSSTPDWGSATVKVYVKEVDRTTFTSSESSVEDWETMTQVYNGSLPVSNGQMTINFTSPYDYADGNLMIGIKIDQPGSSSSVSWTSVYGSSYTALYGYWYSGYSSSYMSYSGTYYYPKTTINYLPTAYPRITTLAEGTITQTTAQLTWTAPSANVTGYAYQYKLSDGTWPETWENLAANATSVTLEGLTKASNYDFRIKALYGEHESVASTFSFATACDLAELPWTENFNNWTAGILAHPCWVNERIVDGTGSGTLSVFQVENNTLKLPDMPNGTRTKLVLPDMVIPTGASYRFVISVNRNASGTTHPQEGVRVFASSNGEIEGATQLGFLYRNCSQTDGGVVTAETTTGWYTYEFAIPFDGPCNIILRGESTYGSATYMDDLKVSEIPHCAKPSALTFQSSTNNSATFTWTDGEEGLTAWQIAYKLNSDFDPYTDECTIANVTSKPGTISGLQASSHYYAYIRSNCGDGTYSDWSDAYCEFDTQCETIATLDDNFDSHTGVSGGSTNNLPTCWNYINTSTNNSYKGYPVIYSASNYSYSGTNHLRFCSYYYSGAADQYAILPEMKEVNGMRVEFWARYYNSNNDLIVGVMTDPADASTFVPLADGTITDLTITYQKYRFDISGATGKYIAFKMPAATTSTKYVLIDDLKVKAIPSCEDVNNPTCTAFTAHTATLAWTLLDNTQDQWQVAYKAGADFDPTDATAADRIVDVNDNTNAVIDNLEAHTTYYAYVRAKCGTNSFGAWSDAYATFTTSDGNLPPTSVVATPQDIESTAAKISWTGNSTNDNHEYYELYISTESTAPTASVTTSDPNLVSNITNTYYQAENLTPSTNYYVWVRDICGTDGNSTWTALEGDYFTTKASCPAPENLAVTPDSETAEGATITWDGTNDSFVVERGSFDLTGTPVAVTVLEEGFENNGTSLPTGWTCSGNAWSVGTNYNSSVHTGTACAKISIGSYDSESYLITPEMDLSSLASATINLWYTNIAWGSDIDEFGVYYRVNGGAWNELFYTTDAHASWTEMGETTLPNLAANYQIGFYIYSNWGHGVAIDDITIAGTQYPIAWAQDGTAANNGNTGSYTFTGLAPETTYMARVKGVCSEGESEYSEVVSFTTREACSTPSNFTLSSVGANSATFSWNGGNATAWRVWVKKSSDEEYPTTYKTVQNTPSTTINELEATTTYDVKIAPECNLTKTFEVEHAFTTAYGVPFVENFTANSIPANWARYTGSVAAAFSGTNPTTTTGGWVFNNTYVFGQYHARINIYNSNNNKWLTTPNIDLTTATDASKLYLVFDLAITDYASTNAPGSGEPANGDQFRVLVSTNGGATWTENNSWVWMNEGGDYVYSDVPNTGQTVMLPLSTYANGSVMIAFYAESSGTDFDIHIDNVRVGEIGTYEREIKGYGKNEGGYVLLASPIGTVYSFDIANNMNMIADPAENYDLYYFDQASDGNGNEWINYKDSDHGGNFNLISGKGYLYANKDDVALTFTGMPYSGNGVVALAYTEDNESVSMRGWNLIGNPFASNATMNKPFYRMNSEGSALKTETEDVVVSAMEGVFVKATEAGQSVTFTAQTSKGGQHIAKTNIMVSDSKGKVLDNAIIRFDNGETLSKFSFNANSSKIYMPVEGKDYAIANVESQAGVMPLNFMAETNGSYTLSFTSEEVSFSYLHLIDNLTGIDSDLLANPSYSFDAQSTDYAQRFRLVFATGTSVDDDSFGFINANGNLCIFGIEGEATVQVFDVLGHMLSSETFNGSYEKRINGAPGVYMVRLINGNDVKVQKIVVR